DDLSFCIPQGATFGILGATGSGKSTIAYLLNRLYDLPEDGGKICIGGADIRGMDRFHLRRHIGLVLQEPFLFSKTVRENIAIAAPATEDILRKNAEIAAVDGNIMEFKHGYDTMVGERGVTLSGGQKQRVAIARTLMMDCPILIFDDSMSALDMETDEKIRLSLREHVAGKTVILISHRISALMQADKVLVLENGRVAQLGAHAELMAEDGVYRRVYKMQSDAQLLKTGEEGGDALG
ncbi:MAG: ATP-binding cassette domain-containing protein, partial [Clostridiales bacterium]|nr:ATP-binding cassette domain-containing protein [Clostridiales bacterium]